VEGVCGGAATVHKLDRQKHDAERAEAGDLERPTAGQDRRHDEEHD
jgi:hypothetical protein